MQNAISDKRTMITHNVNDVIPGMIPNFFAISTHCAIATSMRRGTTTNVMTMTPTNHNTRKAMCTYTSQDR